MDNKREVGNTKKQGWEIGVSKTIPISVPEAWEALTSEEGRELWFGEGGDLELEKGVSFATQDGTVGKVVSVNEGDGPKGKLLRMRWRPSRWDFDSTLQVRVKHASKGATITFHQEKMRSSAQREEMRTHWQSVLERIEESLLKSAG